MQRLKQPVSDPSSPLTNPIIGQEELAGEDCTHSASMETGAEDVSPTSSSGVMGALERHMSSLAEAVEEEPAAEKAAREEADKAFLEKNNKPEVQAFSCPWFAQCTCPSEHRAFNMFTSTSLGWFCLYSGKNKIETHLISAWHHLCAA